MAVAVAERLSEVLAAMGNLQSGPRPSLQPVPTGGHPNGSLVPPRAEFSPEQLAALAELQWRSGKHLEVRGNAFNRTVRYLQGLSLEPPAEAPLAGLTLAETTARNFLQRNRELLRLEDPSTELDGARQFQDELGYTQVHFDQRYEGLQVWPAGLTVQMDRAGHAHLLIGSYVPTPAELELTPRLEPGEAGELARRSLGVDMATPLETEELIVHAPIEAEVRLAYRIELHPTPFEHWLVVVDARTGEVLESLNQVCSSATVGSGTDLGGQNRSVGLWSEGGGFYMVDASKPMFDSGLSDPPSPGSTFGGIIILDAKGVDPGVNPDDYAPEVISSGNANSGFPAAGISASFNLSLVYDYFRDRHGRNSINGTGGTIVGVVNVPIDNAFWNQGVITLGSGDTWADSLDFVGHEMAHGVTERTAGLIYRDQSGAMNEAFSDILGESAESYHHGQTDWQLGSQMSRRLRDMSNPGAFDVVPERPSPSRMSEILLPDDPALDDYPGRDNGGVHFNSGIINHAFYQLAEGLPEAIGIQAAERIFYRALTTKLQQQSQFIDCRFACVQAAVELFGAGSPEAIRTGEAFNAVEIFDQAPPPGPTPIPDVAGPDALLFTYVDPFSGLTFLGRREAAQGDPDGGVVLSPGVAMAPHKRPALLGDGSAAMVVTANNDIALVDTLTGQGQSLGFVGLAWSVGMSADGQFAAIILRDQFGQPRNQINVIRLATQQVETYDLLAPTLDGASIGTVLYGDTLDFSIDAGFLYYDALNRLRFSDGSQFDNWSIYVIDRNTGREFEVVRPIPGLNIGNPSLGQIHNHRLVFEAQDTPSATSTIYGMDVVSGRIGPLFTVNSSIAVGYPCLNGDDTTLYFSDYYFSGGFLTQAIIGTIGVTSDGLSFSGDASPTLLGNAAGPLIGAVYRRGTFVGLPEVNVTATVPETTVGGAPPGVFTLTRTGSTTTPLALSFLLTGTARNGTDFFGVPLSATIAAGLASTTVSILPFENAARVEDDSVILTLSQAPHYQIGANASATITIVNESLPAMTFAEWSTAYGVVGEGGNGDGDAYPNLIEFALGTDPNAIDGPDRIRGELLQVGLQQHLALVVTRQHSNPAVSYTVEIANEPNGPWNSGPPHTVEAENTADRLVVRDAASVSAQSRRFMRLLVEQR
jgi:Zn-dependent metalloprotease